MMVVVVADGVRASATVKVVSLMFVVAAAAAAAHQQTKQ